jgi:hypothetical protein
MAEARRLRRSVLSRLVGDRFLGSVVPSQVLFVLAVASPAPGVFRLVLPVVAGIFAVPAVCWSARISEGCLRCSVLGVTTLSVDLRASADVGVERRTGLKGFDVWVLVIHDARVLRRVVGRHRLPETVDYLTLGYTRYMSRKRLQAWAQMMRSQRGTGSISSS